MYINMSFDSILIEAIINQYSKVWGLEIIVILVNYWLEISYVRKILRLRFLVRESARERHIHTHRQKETDKLTAIQR